MLDGDLTETRYAWPTSDQVGEMVETGESTYGKDEVSYMHDKIGLHRVQNLSDKKPAVSLHVYCPPFDSCNGFDQTTGKSITCKITFFSIHGEKVKYENEIA